MPKHTPRSRPAASPRLSKYGAKRNFDRTPEPKGGAAPGGRGRLKFVVQKHAARRLHYDLRLELDGTLKSWAIPKGPSLDPGARPLAVQVEDHPLEYARFEGVIPEGQYGAGEVIVWDKGEWEPLADPREGLAKGDLKFMLHGQRLRGEWALVRMKKRPHEREEKNWLLIKKRDAAATKEDVLSAATSVVTGKRVEDLEAPRAAGRRIRVVAPREPSAGAGESLDPSRLRGAVQRAQPGTLAPQLAIASERPPEGDEWLHEIKYDGYRLICVIGGGKAKLLTRTGQDWTRTFPGVAKAAVKLPFAEAIVDGEVMVLDERGVSDFQALQGALKGSGRAPLVYFAFDLPFAGGWDLRKCALMDRKDLLRRAIEGDGGTIRFSDHIRGRGPEVLREALAAGLEGIVSKRADAAYESRRTETWLKFKGRRTGDFVVVGFTKPERTREALGALVLATKDGSAGGGLVYCGRVGTGFDTRTLHDLKRRLEPLEVQRPAIAPPTDSTERKGVRWVEPRTVVEVEYASVSRDGRIRHASYLRLRPDKGPEDVEALGRDGVAADAGSAPGAPVVRPSKTAGVPEVGGVAITNADRVIYPEVPSAGRGRPASPPVTKLRVAEYYFAAAERMLPFLVNRPLSLLRHPKGLVERGFFQRHPMEAMPDSIGVTRMAGHEKDYIVIRDVGGLMALVQFGTLEFHPWGSTVDAPEHPDFGTFDLDPGEGVPWEGVVTAALAMRDYLAAKGLASFVKTSGGKGVHIVVPLEGATWEDLRVFGRSVATEIAGAAPRQFTAASTTDRRGRIYIDHLRNRSGSTSVAAYSLRARPGAAVSAPLSWEELRRCSGPAAYTINTMAGRLKGPDPWREIWTAGNRLPRAPVPEGGKVERRKRSWK